MRIGVLGSGQIGGTVARLFARAGHEVALAHAGGPQSLREQVAALGPRARAATVDEAADFGEVVVLAIPWRSRDTLPAARLRGKVVVDTMNHYRPDMTLHDLGGSTSSEEVAKVLPGARLVKALNHLGAADLGGLGRSSLPAGQRTALLLAGDDREAKQIVAGLLAQIGFAPVDTGTLREGGRLQQAGGPLAGRPLSGAEAEELLHAAWARAGPGAAPAH
jgi:predicted dinucleotide-binding enzyme